MKNIPVALAAAALSTGAAAQTDKTDAADQSAPDKIYEEVFITGGKDAIREVPGSANLVDEFQIEKFDTTDINDLLQQVPGVYLRQEDGYGLRPNIGIRGATSERSQKITLMEDGVLIAPAPYSAPAAYYFPNVNRMSAVEVFKGPASIHYGPHTVGGAMNLVTQPIPDAAGGRAELTLGNDDYQKYRLFYGDNHEQFGYWVDGLRYSADGFKDLDGGGDTGFERNDINTKLQWRSGASAAFYQQVDLKLGYAEEDSDETYLGLTDADFEDDENRRYAASQHDRFESEHWQAHVLYLAEFAPDWQLNASVYFNQYDRAWNKFDGFIDAAAPHPSVVLQNPGFYPQEIALLRGEANSNGSAEQTIDVTNFDREYGSSGIAATVTHQREIGATRHDIDVGFRFHHDYVERNHTPRGYLMVDEALVYDGVVRPAATVNEWETDAIALFVSDTVEYRDWKFELGLRYEDIEGETDNTVPNDPDSDNSQSIVLPGAGVLYQWNDNVSLLAGVHKGFSPANPSETADPEESINYEYGVRYQRDSFTLDVIGFFSDYDNLIAGCRVSDPCEAGEQFNGGEVEIAGAEVTSTYTGSLANGWLVPVSLVYTYTESAFQSSFESGFSQWGLVRQGDELPYTPEHQGRLQVGLSGNMWAVDLAVNYVSEMRESAGRGAYIDGDYTQELTTFDLSASYEVMPDLQLKLIGENITDEQEIVSRRPFGARPNQPFTVKFGAVYRF